MTMQKYPRNKSDLLKIILAYAAAIGSVYIVLSILLRLL